MKFADAMVSLGMCRSKGDANRLVMQGAVSFRFADSDKWLPLDEAGMEILEPYPDLYIRVGNGNWRCVKDGHKGEPPFSQYRGIALCPGVMVNGEFCMTIPLADIILGPEPWTK